MFVFEVLFLIGAVGFGTMAVLAGLHGVGDHGTGHHHHGPQHAPSSPGDHQASIGAHVKVVHDSAKAGPFGMRFGQRAKSVLFISPLDVFAMCLGAGAAGLLLREVLSPALLPWAAALAAIAVAYGIVRPLFAFAYRFASKPSEGLESAIARTARAISRFDRDGRGLISLTLDGETIQILAQLISDDQANGVKVNVGDEVVVVEVDARRNTCRVTRLLAA